MSEWNTLAGGERKSCRVSTDEADKTDFFETRMSSRLQVDYYSNLTPENF
ncbi:hypothetical protein L208DRAFT_1404181 [Tricholoma matsutake]|nr:hypothetical protein L208DRAFT_1404181 [Tricholoma matsutake 945]